MTEQQDSCINSIKHFSEFEEIYDAYMKQHIFAYMSHIST